MRVATYILAMALPMGATCAAILRVGPDAGDDFATIQVAVDAAVNGDVIDIAFGFYDEQIVIVGKDLSLRGPGQTYAGNQGAFLLPTSLPANAVTPGGRSIHAALVLEQAHVNLRFLSIFGLSLPSGERNAAEILAGIGVLGPGASLDARFVRVIGFGKQSGSFRTVDEPCGLLHTDYYNAGAGILAIDAEGLNVAWSAFSGPVGIAAICTDNLRVFQSAIGGSTLVVSPSIFVIGDGAEVLDSRIITGDTAIHVIGDSGTFSRNVIRRPEVGFRIEGDDHAGENNIVALKVNGTLVVDLGERNSIGFREQGKPPAHGDPADPTPGP